CRRFRYGHRRAWRRVGGEARGPGLYRLGAQGWLVAGRALPVRRRPGFNPRPDRHPRPHASAFGHGVTRRILGLEFSGGSDAGRKIWIAEGQETGSRLRLIDLRPAAELPGGEAAPGTAIAALARYIVAVPNTVTGCDFPFSIPRSLIEEPSWEDF